MKWRYVLPFAAPIVMAMGALALAAPPPDVSGGVQAFTVCKACHTVEKGGRNGIGPNLAGVVGRRAGAMPGFGYSPAMKNAGLTWDAKTLDRFLAAPARTVPGTRMPISVPDPAKRAALIAYLSSNPGR